MEALNIHQKLAYVQSKLKTPKGQYNSFGKYHYRSCEDILEGLKPLLQEVGATLRITDTIEHIGDRYYVKATVIFEDATSSLEVTAYAREEESRKGMDGSQVTGSSSSYARKYALNGMFCIDDTKDADATNEGEAPKKAAPKPPEMDTEALCTNEQRGRIVAEMQRAGIPADDIKAFTIKEFKKDKSVDLTISEADKLLAHLSTFEKKGAEQSA